MDEAGVGRIERGSLMVPPSSVSAEERRLRDACQKFEGLLLGIMMKDALRETPVESSGGAAAGLDSFRDFCIEQTANTMAESSSLGLADQLFADLGRGGNGL